MPNAPYTSALAQELAPDVLERFLRYVRIDTQSQRERTRCPSTPGQMDLARLLVEELRNAGVDEVDLDENGYVTATLEPTGQTALEPTGETALEPTGETALEPTGETAPGIGLIAHLDTSPDAPGSGVEPIVHERYGGGVIELPRGGARLDPATMPELEPKVGHDIVTSSGDTLLGADDKAGVAEIMAAVTHLAAHPERPRPRLRIAFTPDEEIGEGATLFDIPRFGSLCAYTLDGSELGELQDETFSAKEAVLTIHGVEVHPGQATGKLVNALRLASRIVAALPARLAPETTSGRQGFIHPYELSGAADIARIRVILRDFDEDTLEGHQTVLERTAQEVIDSEPRARLEMDVRWQYHNMHRYIEQAPYVTAAAEEAIREEGIEPLREPIRGGTDGSR